MPPADAPLTRDRILAAAEDVIRRFGPAKATVVDVARALGVSHAAVYRHVATKAELRDLVVGRWVEATMPPLRAIAAQPGPAPQRLRRLFDALIAVKRRRAADDPELFAAYRTLAADAQSVVAAHVDELVGLAATVIRSGVKEGTFRTVDPVAAGRAVLVATSRFHHPAHAAEWADPAIDAAYNDVWQLLMDGLCVAKSPLERGAPGRRSSGGFHRSGRSGGEWGGREADLIRPVNLAGTLFTGRITWLLPGSAGIARRVGDAGGEKAVAADAAGVAAAAGGAVCGGVVAAMRQGEIDAEHRPRRMISALDRWTSGVWTWKRPLFSTPALVARLASCSKARANSGRQSGYPE